MLSTIENMPDHNTAALFNVQHVVLSGFKSRSQSILNQSITMWNRTFGRAEALEYPEEIRKVLLILRSMTEMQLPSLQEAETDQVGSTLCLMQRHARLSLIGNAFADPFHQPI